MAPPGMRSFREHMGARLEARPNKSASSLCAAPTHLLKHRRVLLCDMVKLVDREIDLAQASALLRCPRGDLLHALGDLPHRGQDPLQDIPGQTHEVHAFGDLFAGTIDECVDFARGLGASLRQRADFRCDDGETPSGLAGPVSRFVAKSSSLKTV